MALAEYLNESSMPLKSRLAETFTSTELCLLGSLVRKVCRLSLDSIRTCDVRVYQSTFWRYGQYVRENDFKFLEACRSSCLVIGHDRQVLVVFESTISKLKGHTAQSILTNAITPCQKHLYTVDQLNCC